MQISESQKATLGVVWKSALAGMVLIAVAGQWYPGYMLDSNATLAAKQASQSAVDASAALVCAQIYQAAPDSAAKLVVLRAGQSYAASQDAGIAAAADKAVKAFADAKITPAPYGYAVRSSCGEQLFKPPAKAA